MRWVFICASLLFCLFVAPAAVAYAEDGGDGNGPMSGVLKKVESTVTETTESVGNVIGSETVEFVEGTLENVVTVVEKTTAETVQASSSAVTGIVEKLPEIPVAAPVLDEVSQVVNKTTEKVSESVESVGVEETVDAIEKIAETPRLPRTDAPDIDVQPDEVIEPPVNETRQGVENDESTSMIESPEIPEPTDPMVDEETIFISNEVSQQTAVHPVNQVSEDAKMKAPAEQGPPLIPIQSDTQWDRFPVAITTGTTSVISPLVTHGGSADVVPGIVDGFTMVHNLSGRPWVHSDEHMRIQWVHAPPGQPPQSNPFLQAKK
ncbi:hypothetical protein [Sporosarcina koreensis]|uniref:Uncharacterized protein n=1 Tax=Sporosarcina koreensis TaxID=334735 RepID=A0ABW0U293_9BACL